MLITVVISGTRGLPAPPPPHEGAGGGGYPYALPMAVRRAKRFGAPTGLKPLGGQIRVAISLSGRCVAPLGLSGPGAGYAPSGTFCGIIYLLVRNNMCPLVISGSCHKEEQENQEQSS